MGNTMPTLSTRWLPKPTTSDAESVLRDLGITYLDGEDNHDRDMWRVKFSDDAAVRLLCLPQFREDMASGELIDVAEHRVVATITWMSKGSYDNEARVRVVMDPADRRVTTHDIVADPQLPHRWQLKPKALSPARQKEQAFVDLLDRYHEHQARGQPQHVLDQLRAEVERMQHQGLSEGWLTRTAMSGAYAWTPLVAQTQEEGMRAALAAARGTLTWRRFVLRDETPEEEEEDDDDDEEESKGGDTK